MLHIVRTVKIQNYSAAPYKIVFKIPNAKYWLCILDDKNNRFPIHGYKCIEKYDLKLYAENNIIYNMAGVTLADF